MINNFNDYDEDSLIYKTTCSESRYLSLSMNYNYNEIDSEYILPHDDIMEYVSHIKEGEYIVSAQDLKAIIIKSYMGNFGSIDVSSLTRSQNMILTNEDDKVGDGMKDKNEKELSPSLKKTLNMQKYKFDVAKKYKNKTLPKLIINENVAKRLFDENE